MMHAVRYPRSTSPDPRAAAPRAGACVVLALAPLPDTTPQAQPELPPAPRASVRAHTEAAARAGALRPLARAVALTVLALACGDPSYVSLGRNIQSVASAGSGSVLEPVEGFPLEEPESPVESFPLGAPVEPEICALASVSVAVDSACNTRSAVACPIDSGEESWRLRAALSDLLRSCTDREQAMTVIFSAGCASAFSLDVIDAPGIEALSSCVATRLANERYDCAQALDCGRGSTFQIPTR